MKKISKVLLFVFIASLFLFVSGCGTTDKDLAEQGEYIVEAKDVVKLLGKEGVVFVDARKASNYKNGHIQGAVNISRSDIVENNPVPNLLAPKQVIEKVLGMNGIANDTTVVIYDNNNNMDSARLWWTLMVYGHENIKVVSGGYEALKASGQEVSKELPSITPQKYIAENLNTNMLATLEDVKAQVNDPKDNVVLLDTRSQKEYDEGTIPGSILKDYSENNYKDGTYKPVQHILINYKEKGITPDKTVIMYCKTSIRGAETYLALYNAGYRNLKLYDGAWVEYSSDNTLPVQKPSGTKVQPTVQDMS